jgi:hypothetical protein
LIDALADVIPKLSIENGVFLGGDAFDLLASLDHILPANRREIGLAGYISDRPVMHFVFESISAELRRARQYEIGTARLIDLPQYADARAVSERLVADFETLPWQYRLFARSNVPASYQAFWAPHSCSPMTFSFCCRKPST